MGFPLVPKTMTLNDLERCYGLLFQDFANRFIYKWVIDHTQLTVSDGFESLRPINRTGADCHQGRNQTSIQEEATLFSSFPSPLPLVFFFPFISFPFSPFPPFPSL